MIELLVVIGIIGLLAGIAIVYMGGATKKARDTKRKADLSQIGRMLSASSCYVPTAGAGDYDLKQVADDMIAQNPQYASYASSLPKDPKTGSDAISGYRYQVTSGDHCVLYGNLENTVEPVTLSVTDPTPNSGTGVLDGSVTGPNGTNLYYQISK